MITEALDAAVQLHKAGQLREAELRYREILEQDPDNPDILHLLGLIAHQSGKHDIAIALVQKAIECNPHVPLFHLNLGNIYVYLQDADKALSSYLQAVQIKSDYIEAYDKILSLKPDFAAAYLNRGNAKLTQGRAPEAMADFRMAIKYRPDYASAYNNIGTALEQTDGRLDEVIDSYRHAIALKPDFFEAYNNLGVVFQYQNRYEEAVENYRTSLRLQPEFEEAHFNLSLVLLVTGDFSQGWEAYEWRLKKKDWLSFCPHHFSIPQWDGRPFPGKALFVYDEQGLGDTLQFVRYLPMVKALGGKVILETAEPLLKLLKTAAGIDEMVGRPYPQDPNHDFDFHVPLLSLPKIFHTDFNNIPAETPYLSASDEKAAYWRKRIRDSRFTVGIAWSGKSTHRNDRNRSCLLKTFEPLLQLEGIRLIGLQKGKAASQVSGLPVGLRFENWGQELEDFHDTAGLIQNLDLIITVDTSVAHLAGAMGKTVWLLLPFSPDWRWFLERSDTPWYPTMRLFRQPETGDWDTVFRNVKMELQALLQHPNN